MGMTWKEKIAAWKDITRKPGYELKFYPAPGGKKAPFALIAPGGGYQAVCSFVEGEPFARELNKRGYSAFVLYYRVAKQAQYPAPQDDMARGLKEILDHAQQYNIQTEGFSIWGASAGGHLAASFGSDAVGYAHYGLPKPAAMVLVYPVITLGEHTHKGTRNNHLGKNAPADMVKKLSVQNLVTGNYPPTYIWNTLEDKTVPPINSRLFAQAAQEAGVECRYHCYNSGPHGCGLARGLACEGWFDEAVAFWQTHIGK